MHHNHKRLGFFQVKTAVMCLAVVMISACSQDKPADAPAEVTHSHAAEMTAAESDSLVGCYNMYEPNGIAQLRLSQTADGLVMQMKEPKGATSAWDNPEKLNTPSVKDGWALFSTNAINLTRNDVTAIAARPDQVMAIAALQPVSANTNPMLDSNFALSIMGTVSTVYQVPCDDTPVDLKK